MRAVLIATVLAVAPALAATSAAQTGQAGQDGSGLDPAAPQSATELDTGTILETLEGVLDAGPGATPGTGPVDPVDPSATATDPTAAATAAPSVAPGLETAPIPRSYVVLVEPGTDLAMLAAAWAVLEPDLSRARPGSSVFELRIGTDFPPAEVLDLLNATKGVLSAEPNFPLAPATD
ncbi:MAG: hypothetical protein ACFBRM_15820 [Pikeienuella sp.]